MEINFISNSTKVKQLTEAIRLAISQGEFKEGEMLPSVNQISTRYHVARDTAFKAFKELKVTGLIQSVSTKGYYVSSSVNQIMVLLDIFSPYKNDLYNALTRNISPNNRLDLYFHHYNEVHFNRLIRDSVGKYNKYLVMNFRNEKYSEILDLIDKSRLLLLDFGEFDKRGFSYVCQGFDTTLYDCLKSGQDLFLTYSSFKFVFPKTVEHPRGGIHYFFQFCNEIRMKGELLERPLMESDLAEGAVYLIASHSDLIEAVKLCRAKGLRLGKDVGIVTFNDAPMLEVIENGISAISTDFRQMGIQAARFINNELVQCYIPTKLIVRGSLQR